MQLRNLAVFLVLMFSLVIPNSLAAAENCTDVLSGILRLPTLKNGQSRLDYEETFSASGPVQLSLQKFQLHLLERWRVFDRMLDIKNLSLKIGKGETFTVFASRNSSGSIDLIFRSGDVVNMISQRSVIEDYVRGLPYDIGFQTRFTGYQTQELAVALARHFAEMDGQATELKLLIEESKRFIRQSYVRFFLLNQLDQEVSKLAKRLEHSGQEFIFLGDQTYIFSLKKDRQLGPVLELRDSKGPTMRIPIDQSSDIRKAYFSSPGRKRSWVVMNPDTSEFSPGFDNANLSFVFAFDLLKPQ